MSSGSLRTDLQRSYPPGLLISLPFHIADSRPDDSGLIAIILVPSPSSLGRCRRRPVVEQGEGEGNCDSKATVMVSRCDSGKANGDSEDENEDEGGCG
jgi:hypothetical protein